MYGLNIDPRNVSGGGNPSAADLKALGVRVARYSFKVGTDDALTFYLSKVRELADAGIRSLLILTNESLPRPKPAWDAADASWDAYIAELVALAGRLARQLPPGQAMLQIWNEPDHRPTPTYEPTLRPAVYARMLQRLYTAIKTEAPHLRVLTAGLASGDPGWLAQVRQSLGGARPFDAVAVHPYGQRPAPDWPDAQWGFGDARALLERYHAVANAPLWITEIGINSPDEGFQAEYLERFYRNIPRTCPFVEQILWFCYADGMVSPFGLKRADGSPKALYHHFQSLATLIPQEDPMPDELHTTSRLITILQAEFGPAFHDVRHLMARHPSKRSATVDFTRLSGIAVHHTAFQGTWRQTARYHVYTRQWPTIAYTIGVSYERIFLLKNVEEKGNHVWGMNEKLLSVVVMGDLTQRQPHSQDIPLLARVIRCYDAFMGRRLEVRGHADWALPGHGTACPGPALRAWAWRARDLPQPVVGG